MKLQTIRVEGFKRFREAFTISDLRSGINLIAAANGKGKSTIAEAIRVAFLERHKTASLGDSLAPWTQPGATPTVQIQFERLGKVHRLNKAFGSKKACSLVVEGGATLTGDDAEQHLCEMLSFRLSKRGESSAEHHGVPGLLWVQQGTSGQIVAQVDNAHEYISRALGDDLGELAASEGDKVIQRVEQDLALLQTRTGKPTGEFLRAKEELDRKTAALEELRERIRTYVTKVDTFSDLQARHAQGERTRPWEAQRLQAAQAREKLEALDAVSAQHRELQLQLRVTQGSIERLQAALSALNAEDRAVADREVDLDAAQERQAAAQALVEAAEATLRTAREEDTATRAQASAARRAATIASHEHALATATRRKGELQAQLKLVQEQQEELALRQASVGRLAGFEAAAKRLAPRESALAGARAKLEAASTRLEYELHAPGIRLAGEALSGSGTRTLAQAAEITVEGIGTIRVLPGSKDLAQLQSDVDRAEAELAQLLHNMGAASAEDARAREQEWTEAQADVRRLKAVIAGIAQAGVEELRAQIHGAEGEVEQHRQALESMPLGEDHGEIVPVRVAEASEAVAQAALRKAQDAFDAARPEALKAQEQLRLARKALDTARAVVETAGRDEHRRKLSADLVSAHVMEETQEAQATALSAQINAARPDLLRSDIDRFTKSADALEAAHGRVRTELDVLAGELKAQGALGLQEEAAALEEEVERLKRQVADRTRRAAALSHLLKVLTDKRAEVARSIRAPLQKHINHYLAIQFPGASIELDEGLRPQRFTRTSMHGSETGSFEELSGGEREQIGVIARLAYADLLKEAGKPTLVMLDDSLVNCDLDRLAQMKRVIYDAAQRHQILLFTCHQELWLDLGVEPRTLQ
ncbi:AAA family ATPase [Ramlibacter sp. AN1133]|uniref:AAA family ATPase n=1 Tax=Ramlibacter sp. AN1133 TaxID=3133429 RepID=UPI0030C13BEA